MLAADTLMGQCSDLAGKPSERELADRGIFVPLDRAAQRLDPQLARPVHIDVRDIRAAQRCLKRC
jgi:hypothetical protein